jgi:hypothetical protein
MLSPKHFSEKPVRNGPRKSGLPDLRTFERRSRVNPRHESRFACHKNELTRVTRIFQKRAFTKAAHDARVGDRRGLFCRLAARALMRRKSGSRAAPGLRQPRCFVVFHCYFLPVFARDDGSRSRARTSSGCSSGAKGLWARKKLMVARRGLRSRIRETQSCGSAASLFWDCYLQ